MFYENKRLEKFACLAFFSSSSSCSYLCVSYVIAKNNINVFYVYVISCLKETKKNLLFSFLLMYIYIFFFKPHKLFKDEAIYFCSSNKKEALNICYNKAKSECRKADFASISFTYGKINSISGLQSEFHFVL